MFLFVFSLSIIVKTYFTTTRMFSKAQPCFPNWQCLSWVFSVDILQPAITSTLLSFVFLVAAIPFGRERSYKCINRCWRVLKASCRLQQKALSVGSAISHQSIQMWCLKYIYDSKAPHALHRLHMSYPGKVMHFGLNFFLKSCLEKMLIWTFALKLNLITWQWKMSTWII